MGQPHKLTTFSTIYLCDSIFECSDLKQQRKKACGVPRNNDKQLPGIWFL
jgi:hypothetical protein